MDGGDDAAIPMLDRLAWPGDLQLTRRERRGVHRRERGPAEKQDEEEGGDDRARPELPGGIVDAGMRSGQRGTKRVEILPEADPVHWLTAFLAIGRESFWGAEGWSRAISRSRSAKASTRPSRSTRILP